MSCARNSSQKLPQVGPYLQELRKLEVVNMPGQGAFGTRAEWPYQLTPFPSVRFLRGAVQFRGRHNTCKRQVALRPCTWNPNERLKSETIPTHTTGAEDDIENRRIQLPPCQSPSDVLGWPFEVSDKLSRSGSFNEAPGYVPAILLRGPASALFFLPGVCFSAVFSTSAPP